MRFNQRRRGRSLQLFVKDLQLASPADTMGTIMIVLRGDPEEGHPTNGRGQTGDGFGLSLLTAK